MAKKKNRRHYVTRVQMVFGFLSAFEQMLWLHHTAWLTGEQLDYCKSQQHQQLQELWPHGSASPQLPRASKSTVSPTPWPPACQDPCDGKINVWTYNHGILSQISKLQRESLFHAWSDKQVNFLNPVLPPVHDTWRLCNQIDNMTLDNLSGGLYLEDVTGPVRLCQATSCGGLADIQCDTTRGVLSSLLPNQRK